MMWNLPKRVRGHAGLGWALAIAAVVAGGSVMAQPNKLQPRVDRSAQVVNQVGIDQRLNAQVPMDAEFRDEAGNPVRLGQLISQRPVILILAYYRCPMLCNEVMNGVVKALRVVPFEPAEDFDIVTISIDPTETPEVAAKKKASYVRAYGHAGAEKGWHFLTGGQPAIDAVAQSVGFRYVYDQGSNQYAHAGGIMLLTPAGKVSRYFYGVEFSPKDLRFGLMDASDEKIGSLVEKVLLLCFHYDPETGKYGFAVMTTLRIAGGMFLMALGTFWYRMRKRDRKLKQTQAVA